MQAAVSIPLDASHLRRIFLDAFGRPPYPQECINWLKKQRSELIDAVVETEDFWRNWIEEQLYYLLLIDNFRPPEETIQSLSVQIAEGSLSACEALHRICISSSFDRRNPGPDTFVTVVMEQVLGMTVHKLPRELEIGKGLYDGAQGKFLGIMGDSQADVLRIAFGDARAIQHLLRREHQRMLRDQPAEVDMRAWRIALEEDKNAFTSILKAWYNSDGYDRRLVTRNRQPNRLFVRSLFVDLIGRLPDEAEAQHLRSALDGLADSRPLRALVARLLLDSGKAQIPSRSAIVDPPGWIAELFARLLGREPSSEEKRVFVESLENESCRPATVLYAILSHPEYDTW